MHDVDTPARGAARDARGRGIRAILWSLLVLVLVAAALPLSGYFLTDAAQAQAQAGADDQNVRANFWRAVREGDSGYSAVKGPEANVLIQNGGENWRALRNGPMRTYATWLMAGTLLVIALFFLVRGRIRISSGKSGETVPRWNAFERALHWYTAILFLVLLVTGLSLLFGRALLIPVIGKDAFAAYAGLAKDLHNYLGPFFAAGLVLELLIWVRHNIPNATDMAWFAKGGGMFGKSHPSAGRMNGGEKLWFWVLVVFGLGAIGSGLVLDFPQFGQTRSDMQLASLIHLGATVVLTCFAFGHIYIGTLGTEGSLEGMTTGRVDAEWARQHHDIWLKQLEDKGIRPEAADAGVSGGGGAQTRAT